MLTSLLHEVRVWPAIWRRRLAWYRLVGGKADLPFLAMIGLPILGVAGIVCFAYLHGTRIEPTRIQAMQLGAKRANRRESDLQCLAENIYFEARGEPLNGQYAVAEVTLNRTRARNFPHTICSVVHEMRWDPNRRRPVADFSWTELGALSPDDGPAWKRAMEVASAAYDDLHDPIVAVLPDASAPHAPSSAPCMEGSRTFTRSCVGSNTKNRKFHFIRNLPGVHGCAMAFHLGHGRDAVPLHGTGISAGIDGRQYTPGCRIKNGHQRASNSTQGRALVVQTDGRCHVGADSRRI